MAITTSLLTRRAGGCGKIVSATVVRLRISLGAALTTRCTLLTAYGSALLCLLLSLLFRARDRDCSLEVSEISVHLLISPLHETGHAGCRRHIAVTVNVRLRQRSQRHFRPDMLARGVLTVRCGVVVVSEG
jgi:hypothetical protein